MTEKTIKRICRVVIESAIESFYSLTKLNSQISKSQEEKLMEFKSSNKFDEWLNDMLNFTKDFKKHLQLGRSLLKRELDLTSMKNVRINLKKKSDIIEMMDNLSNFMIGAKKDRDDVIDNLSSYKMKDSSTKVTEKFFINFFSLINLFKKFYRN
jgi:hypothetical protein